MLDISFLNSRIFNTGIKMRAKKLIEKMEDLATFFVVARDHAYKQAEEQNKKKNITLARHWAGRASANLIAFNKLDVLIKEAKR